MMTERASSNGKREILIPHLETTGDASRNGQLEVRIFPMRDGDIHEWIKVYLDIDGMTGDFSLVGIERED